MSQDGPVRPTVISDVTPRRLTLERAVTFDAAATVTARPPERLITLAESRAGDARVRDIDTRCFDREVLEEISDARNYLVWWLEQIARGARLNGPLAGELTEAIGRALATITVAFEHADTAHALMVDWRRPTS